MLGCSIAASDIRLRQTSGAELDRIQVVDAGVLFDCYWHSRSVGCSISE